MPCTTLLIGKKASYDGSTLMARNEDSRAGQFDPKKWIVVRPEDQPRHYQAVLTRFALELPENPMRYTAMPNAYARRGIWGEAGFNEANVAMSETETLTSNARVLGADPLVPDGIGEEDMLTVVLPYIHSAREGVLRLGGLLERYGTCEMNGIGFQDENEIWWLESIGGHHWIARRVPDEAYVVVPNQQGIDTLDLVDALGAGRDNLCSADLPAFIREHHLDLALKEIPPEQDTVFDVRAAFGSHSTSDHSYNTPRAWFMLRSLNPSTFVWDGPEADFTPESDDLPWCMIPEHKITVEEVKEILSSYYQGTPWNPYGHYGKEEERGRYRPIGINRNNFVAITQLRPDVPEAIKAVEWIAEGCNAFNQAIPLYANVNTTPAYLSETSEEVTTDSFYWVNRLIGALTDAHYQECIAFIDRYQLKLASMGHAMLEQSDKAWQEHAAEGSAYLERCNQSMADAARHETAQLLNQVLYAASNGMKNRFARSDA